MQQAGREQAGCSQTYDLALTVLPLNRRFTPVALKWASALLTGVEKQHQGIDLFGRDAFVLGRLLSTLGEQSGGTGRGVVLALV